MAMNEPVAPLCETCGKPIWKTSLGDWFHADGYEPTHRALSNELFKPTAPSQSVEWPTIEDIGLDRIIDQRFILHELVGLLLRGDKSVLDDEVWLAATYRNTDGRISYVTEGSREVLPIGETRAAYIAAWNEKCRELGEESARRLALEAKPSQSVEEARAAVFAAAIGLARSMDGTYGPLPGVAPAVDALIEAVRGEHRPTERMHVLNCVLCYTIFNIAKGELERRVVVDGAQEA